MTRLLIASIALLLASGVGARELDPARFSGSDQEKVEKAFAAAVAEPGSLVRLDKRRWKLSRTVTIAPLAGEDRVSLRVVGSREWLNVEYVGTGPAFKFVDLKDSSLNGLSVRGGGIEFVARRSSARVSVRECRVELGGDGAAFLFTDAEGVAGGADMSFYTLEDCEASRAATGFRWIGANNLDPRVTGCRVTDVRVGFDWREGGSNFQAVGCGGSYVEAELFVSNGGFQGVIRDAHGEWLGTVWRTGGDDAAGFGQIVRQEFHGLDFRQVSGPAFVVNKSGETMISVQRLSPGSEIMRENRSAVPGSLTLEGAARQSRIVSIGQWKP